MLRVDNISVSIHPPRVGRDGALRRIAIYDGKISIHPPRVGRDELLLVFLDLFLDISIHPPRVGRDATKQSRRGRTMYFNPPSPCGEGRLSGPFSSIMWGFQSTLPVWGGTTTACFSTETARTFQSTLPVWGGTHFPHSAAWVFDISIHPPRVGRDPPLDGSGLVTADFNPPSPCGEGR